VKLLLYLVIGAGLGELDADDVTAFSTVTEPLFLETPARTAGGGISLASVSVLRPGALLTEAGRGELDTVGPNDGEADKDGVLNGWKDIEVLRPEPDGTSVDRSEERELRIDR
jgi:hypothetical protein